VDDAARGPGGGRGGASARGPGPVADRRELRAESREPFMTRVQRHYVQVMAVLVAVLLALYWFQEAFTP